MNKVTNIYITNLIYITAVIIATIFIRTKWEGLSLIVKIIITVCITVVVLFITSNINNAMEARDK